MKPAVIKYFRRLPAIKLEKIHAQYLNKREGKALEVPGQEIVKKYYILDTNVLLQAPQAPLMFEDNIVVLPEVVLEELDNKKKDKDPEIRAAVRSVARFLDKLREEQGNLYEGVKLPNGGLLKVERNCLEAVELPASWETAKSDNRILSIAKNLQKKDLPVVIVTKDIFLRIKADVLGITAQDYRNEQVEESYQGWREEETTDGVIDQLYVNGTIPWEKHCYPNEFLLLRSESKTCLARYFDGQLLLLHDAEPKFYSFKLNLLQKFAREALRNKDIPLVTIVGATGSGKTLLALGVGLEMVLDKNVYRRMLICRPNVGMGEEIGFLPGNEQEKIAPFMRPIYDNLEQLLSAKNEKNLKSTIDYLFDMRKITTEAIAYLQGRSIVGQYILIDEAQNLTPKQVKGIVTRAGEGTKIVLVGDPEQINSPFLDTKTNGLSWAVEKMKDSPLHAHITLTETKRSPLALDAGQRMR